MDVKARWNWWPYALVVLAVLVVVSIWAVPLRGIVSPRSTDTFLAELGSLMGAIFTAGGLVLAIAALITLVTVRAQARDAAKEVLQQVRAEMDADVTAALTAYDYLFSARNAINTNNYADLREAERLVEEALKKRPDLPHAREWIAETLYDAAFRYFLIHHFNDNFRGIPSGAGSQTDFYTNVHGAIRWTREIVERTHDPDDTIAWKGQLAALYGLAGNADDMLRTASELTEKEREATFHGRRIRLCLSAGLRSSSVALVPALHALLPVRFPAKAEHIREAWLNHRQQAVSWDARFGLWVLRKASPPDAPTIPWNPAVVWMLPFAENQVVLKWKKDANEYVSYPSENEKAPDIDGALRTIDEYFVPICAVDGEVYP